MGMYREAIRDRFKEVREHLQQEKESQLKLFKEHDNVNSPAHYNEFGIECIDAIEAATGEGFEHYLQGNILKYLWRYRYKGKPLEDLHKAQWYLNYLIDIIDDKQENPKS